MPDGAPLQPPPSKANSGIARAAEGLSFDEMTGVSLVPHPASTQLVYREVNERIHLIGAKVFQLGGDQEIDMLCECLSTTCAERIQIAVTAYEQLRDRPSHFAVLPGHEQLEIEGVVDLHSGYVVVEKDAAVLDLCGLPCGQGVSS